MRFATYLLVVFSLTQLAGCGKGNDEASTAFNDIAEDLNDARSAAEPSTTVVQIEPEDISTAQYAAPLSATQKESKEKQVTSWKRSKISPNTSRLSIGDKEELPLTGMQVGVRIDGFRARVLLDCYFFNDRDSQFEGTFQLRLPTGAAPYFCAFGETRYESPSAKTREPIYFTGEDQFASKSSSDEILDLREDTWQKPKVARIVPREKAAYSYGETVRRRVDPALVEWSGSGVFNCRVFPLAPRKLHRVSIGYDVDLTRLGDDLEFRLDLPDGDHSCVVEFDVAEKAGEQISMTPTVNSKSKSGRQTFRFENPQERTIAARIESTGTVLLRGNDPESGAYFATSFKPALPNVAANSSPYSVFLVDTSLSSNPDRFNIWLDLMKATLANNRDTLKHFGVLFFNVETTWWRDEFSENTEENVESLIAFANTLTLEGATDMGQALAQAALPRWLELGGEIPPWDVFLLSDGAATWGESEPYSLSAKLDGGLAGPLFAYSTGMAGTNSRLMSHLARQTGGAVFSVVGEAEIEAASKAHRSRAWKIAGLEIEGSDDLMLAGRPQVVYPGQTLKLVGRGEPAANANIVLHLQQGDQTHEILTPIDHVIESTLAPRSYGQIAVEQLESFNWSTQDIATTYARHFRVVGRSCSLLMLETEEDYERFNIKPQEDAFVVKQKHASQIVQETLDAIGATLGSAKIAFEAWLNRLERMPGVEFKVPTAMKLALKSMPDESFDVAVKPFICRAQTRDKVPAKILKQLSSKDLIYDTIVSEAQRRKEELGKDDALRALSSLVENRPGDIVLMRDVAYSAVQLDRPDQAYHLLRRVASMRPFEPQSYHALARCLAEMGNADLSLLYFDIAYHGDWDDRFGNFHEILALDYLRMLRNIENKSLTSNATEYADSRLKSVAKKHDPGAIDLMVSIAWNTDRTDVDLHVIEPTGEDCHYAHRNTRIGGQMTTDVTTGYGPEMYTLRKARPGRYRVKVRYFSSDINRASTQTKVSATIIENWGRKNERTRLKVVPLKTGKEMHDLIDIVIK